MNRTARLLFAYTIALPMLLIAALIGTLLPPAKEPYEVRDD